MPGALRHSGRAYLVTFSTTGLKPRNVTYYDPLIGQTTLDGISKVLVVSVRYNSREFRTSRPFSLKLTHEGRHLAGKIDELDYL